MTTLLLNSEYKLLYDAGGDDLVAFFATIRAKKRGPTIEIRCKERLPGAMHRITGLSRNTIKKYLPQLQELGLIDTQMGTVVARGRKWSYNNLPRLKNKKLIPIIICKKFTDTKASSFYVRVHSNIQNQNKESSKKAERIKILEQHHRGQTRSLKDLKRAKRLIKKGHTLTSLKNSHRLNSTISNRKFFDLKKDITDGKKISGHYHKSKLIKMGLISQTRNVHLFLEGVFSYSYLYELRDSFKYGGFFIGKKGIYYEDSPTIEVKLFK